MGKAKDIWLEPIEPKIAKEFMKRTHYSGKVVQNSQLHIGVFYDEVLHGAMQFGPSLDKRKLIGLVKGTKWNEFMELNRLAFDELLPRNSESRALGIAMRLLRKHAPHLKWVVSFADATQCGDGTIYRAAGFTLTGVKENQQLYILPFASELDGERLLSEGWDQAEVNWTRRWLDEITPPNGKLVVHKLTVEDRPPTCVTRDVSHKVTLQGSPHGGQRPVAHRLTVQDRPPKGARRDAAHKIALEGHPHAHKMSLQGGHRPTLALSQVKKIMRRLTNGATSADRFFRAIGGQIIEGYQLRYIYFLDKSCRQKLTVPEIPYSHIWETGAGMYKGEKVEAQRADVV